MRIRHYSVALTPSDNDWLAHYGILGQKWGVRRYQNYDGTLTAEGKQHYNNGMHREEDVEKDFDNYVSRNAQEVKRIKELSKKVVDLSSKRDKAYSDYLSKIKLGDKERKDLKKKMDDALGLPPADEEEKELYDMEAFYYVYNEVINRAPRSLFDIDHKSQMANAEYWNAVSNFERKIIDEYANTQVYSSKKGFLGMNVIDRRTEGSQFIQQLINKKDLLDKLGGRFGDPTKESDADRLLDETVGRIVSQLGT